VRMWASSLRRLNSSSARLAGSSGQYFVEGSFRGLLIRISAGFGYRLAAGSIPSDCTMFGSIMPTDPFQTRYTGRVTTTALDHAAINENGISLKTKRVLLLKPRGFCAGVVRAIDIVRIALETFGAPIYVRKEIVHNSYVVTDLAKKGAIFVNELDEVPEGARVIYSAHGVAPEVREASKLRELRVIDATCPLVTKVHVEAVKFAKQGYSLVLIGHRD